MQPCLFCGGDASEPDHLQRCDGRQGAQDAAGPAPLVRVEAYARTEDPETSHAAARSVTDETIGALHAAILRVLARGRPLSDDGIRLALGLDGLPTTPSGARTRRSELAHGGMVVDSGLRGVTASGRACILWTVPADRRVM